MFLHSTMGKIDLLPRSWRSRSKKENRTGPPPVPLYGMWDRLAGFAAEIRSSPFMAEMMHRREQFGKIGTMAALDCATLYALTRFQRPEIVIESGGFIGLSAAFILKALADEKLAGARVYSIEASDDCAHWALIPDELRPQLVPLRAKVENLVRGNQLPSKIDMFLHDSSHRYRHMHWEFKEFWRRLRDGGMLASHDVNITSAFAEFVAKTYAHNRYTEMIDYERTLHQEWGRWGYIGFIVKKM